MDYYKNKEKKKYELNKAHMWPRNKEFFKSYAKQNPYFRFTVFIALGNKENFSRHTWTLSPIASARSPDKLAKQVLDGLVFKQADLIRFIPVTCSVSL